MESQTFKFFESWPKNNNDVESITNQEKLYHRLPDEQHKNLITVINPTVMHNNEVMWLLLLTVW